MPRILTINGGSSSIRFALFEIGKTSERLLDGKVDRIGSRDATLKVRRTGQQAGNLNIEADKPESAVGALVDVEAQFVVQRVVERLWMEGAK